MLEKKQDISSIKGIVLYFGLVIVNSYGGVFLTWGYYKWSFHWFNLKKEQIYVCIYMY